MARPGYSLGIGAGRIKTLGPITLAPMAALAAFAAHTMKIRGPESGRIVGITLNVGGRGGTHVTSALLVKNGANTVATLDVDALTPGTPVDAEGSNLANTEFAKDAVISIETTEAGGTAPTWQNATVQIDYVSIGD